MGNVLCWGCWIKRNGGWFISILSNSLCTLQIVRTAGMGLLYLGQ